MFGPSRDDDDIARGKFELVLTFDRETRLASAEHITPEVGAARLMQRPGVWPAHSHHLDLIEPQVAQQRINELVHDQVPSPPDGTCWNDRFSFELLGRGGNGKPEHPDNLGEDRSEEHKSELQSLMRITYAAFCLKKQNHKT